MLVLGQEKNTGGIKDVSRKDNRFQFRSRGKGQRKAAERPDILVGKVNVDEEPELASAFNISSIPTLVVMRGGEIVNRATGARPKSSILSLLP